MSLPASNRPWTSFDRIASRPSGRRPQGLANPIRAQRLASCDDRSQQARGSPRAAWVRGARRAGLSCDRFIDYHQSSLHRVEPPPSPRRSSVAFLDTLERRGHCNGPTGLGRRVNVEDISSRSVAVISNGFLRGVTAGLRPSRRRNSSSSGRSRNSVNRRGARTHPSLTNLKPKNIMPPVPPL